jgi:predicted RNA-binding Zn ribbon-like protein
MRLWIDNTGLQSAGQCLTKEALGEVDVKGLLQLATLLVFADSFYLNAVGSESVREGSNEVFNQLQQMSNDIPTVDFVGTDDSFAEACENAAKEAADALAAGIISEDLEYWRLDPPTIPLEDQDLQVDFVKIATYSDAELEAIREELRAKKASGAPAFMLVCSHDLREAVKNLVESGEELAPTQARQLNAFLRYYLNIALAQQHQSLYTPAVERAQLLRWNNDLIIKQLNAAIAEVASRLAEGPIRLPPLTAKLILDSKGEPEGVIEAALELRHQATELRAALRKLAEELARDPEDTDNLYAVKEEVSHLTQYLPMTLRRHEKPSLWDGMSIQLVFGLPTLSLDIKKISQWVQYMRQRGKLAVLTDVSRAVIVSSDERVDELYHKLIRNSKKR